MRASSAGHAGGRELHRRSRIRWCGACNNVIDVTPDTGKHWLQVYRPGQVLSLVGSPSARAGLIAVVEGPTSAANGRGASLWVYVSTNGRRWTYNHDMNAVS